MSQANIPVLDLKPQYESLKAEIQAAINRVLESGQFIMGPDVKLFEQEVAAYLGVRHAIAVNSGTDALVIGLKALGIGVGDEVITTPFSFFATAESISNVGATPIFVDINPDTFNINPGAIVEKITPQTKAIMPVHLYGNPAEMLAILDIAQEYNLKVIEDCAQSFGARYYTNTHNIKPQKCQDILTDLSPNLSPCRGEALKPPFPTREGGQGGLGLEDFDVKQTDLSPNLSPARGEALKPPFPTREGGQGGLGLEDFDVKQNTSQTLPEDINGKHTGTIGHVGAYSFFPSKNLGAYGDGGLVVSNDDQVAEFARMLRVHGAKKKYHNEVLGYNSRLDTLQAAVLRVKLPHIDAWNEGRRRVAQIYNQLLADVAGVVTPELAQGHVFHQYTIRVVDGDRNSVQKYLADQGISTMIYYPVPQDKLPVYQGKYPANPVSDLLAGEVLSLPIWPEMEQPMIEQVVKAIKQALKNGV